MRIEKTVFLIDDDKDDLEMLQEALKVIDVDHSILEAGDGLQALNTLERLVSEQRLPCLIVLDINMPKLDGKQTFIAIKSDKQLRDIPVVIFSTSTNQMDRTFFERYNTAYFVKPVDFSGFTTTASQMMEACYHRATKQ